MRYYLLFTIFKLSFSQSENTTTELSFLFLGDIMGHSAQIQAAYDSLSNTYTYTDVFKPFSPLIQQVDYTIANLEVTLGGAPYRGYPTFSSPDALAVACKVSGINTLVTANNHACDRGKRGLLRTIRTLDSLGISHTGTFKNESDRNKTNLLIFKKQNLRIGLLNYTYGTNGLPTPPPTYVNRINKTQMLKDINKSKSLSIDKLIVFLHWGNEYESHPSKEQKQLATFLFEAGADIIIGSHPHVVQKVLYFPKSKTQKERFVAYSLGNFVSNQRARRKDGGLVVKLTIEKQNNHTQLKDAGYYLSWVRKHANTFIVLPCSYFEKTNFNTLDKLSTEKIKRFINDTRILFETENVNVPELTLPIY